MSKMATMDDDISSIEEDIREKKMLDDRLKQRWASKARRRSSEYKRFVDDKLNLGDNLKIKTAIGKNGTTGCYQNELAK